MSEPSTPHPHSGDCFQPVAAVLAFLLPGAGHAYLGEWRRGLLVFAGVNGLFVGGLFIGGIDAIDRREDFVWFLGQALVGPAAIGLDHLHQTSFKVIGPTRFQTPQGIEIRDTLRTAYPFEIRGPDGRAIRVRDEFTGEAIEFTDPVTGQTRRSTLADRPPNVKSLGRPNELGTLFATIAGMMNLIVIVDAAYHRPRRSRRAGGSEHGGAPA
jgi:hypothetical protein